ncbi:MAG: NosD domain-containing protein, partial [Elusimicrobiota bacterium]
LTVSASSATGWAVGDTIAIGPTTGTGPSSTEQRVVTDISGPGPLIVSWSGGLANTRLAATTSPVVVANLTRNVLVRSSGTDTGSDTAYIRALARNATSFYVAHAEFAHLGADASGRYGVTFDGAGAKGSIAGSAVRDGYNGIHIAGASGIVLAENNVSSNAAHGIHLAGAAGNTLSANNAFGNTTAGIYLEGSSGNDVRFNHAYSNSDVGVHLFNGSYVNIVEDNYAYAQPSHGFWLQSGCDHNTLASNNAYVFGDTGILLDGSDGNTLAFNESYSGTRGIRVGQSSDGNLLASNEARLNTDEGIILGSSADGTLIDNLSYANATRGLLVTNGASGSTLVGGGLGYDGSGAADPNTQSELHIDDASSGSLTLKGVRINPAAGISTDGFNREGNYLLSYNQDFDTGTVRLWGDLTLSGDTLTLDYATRLYASTATASKLMRGTGHSASVGSTNDSGALSQIITIEHRDGQWHVDGSSSGADMASFTGSQANLAVPASDTQFILDFTDGGSAVEGDRVDFALIAASQDQNVQKQLLFGPAADGFHDGRSKLAVAADAGVALQGAETMHTLVDMLPGGTYYTFVDSGAFTAIFSSFTNMDPGGIQLSGSGGISLSSSVFDYLGFAAGTNAYITARDLASDIRLDNVGFLLSRSSHGFDSMYNVRVEGTDSSLRWRFSTVGTILWGEDYDYDPNAKVAWPTCGAVASVQSGDWSDNLVWDGGFEPTECNAATVSAGHTVTVDRTDAMAAMTTVRGTLSFSRVAHSSLTIVGGDVTVEPGGHLDLGTEASPIPAGVRAHLVLALGQTAGQYGLIVQDGGDFTVRGATKTPASSMNPTDTLFTTENTLSLSEDPAQLGWAVGDVITVGPSQGAGPGSTEERTITGIAGSIITVDGDFASIHYGTATIDIANLTRNVLVRSSGTDTGGDTAYIRNLATNATSFNLSYGEFAYLGADISPAFGIAFIGASVRGSISRSTIREGYVGLHLDGTGVNDFTLNLIYKNAHGIRLLNSSNNSFLEIQSYSNEHEGIAIAGSSDNNSVLFASFYSNSGEGMSLDSSSGNTLYAVNAFANSSHGVMLSGAAGAAGNLLAENASHSNSGEGLFLQDFASSTLIGNGSYCNSGGILVESSGGNTFTGGALGYDRAGNPCANSGGEISFDAGKTESLALYGVRINPAIGLSTAGFNREGNYLLSYDQDLDTGTVRLWGDYLVSGSTLTLDYSTRLYASTATAPKIMRGDSISQITVNSTDDDNALSQLVAVAYDFTDNLWHVTGSSSGELGTLPSPGGTADFPLSDPQFNLTLSASGALPGDKADFALIAASGEAGVRKKLLFGPSASSFREGKSKLTVAADAGVILRGTAGTPTVMDRLDASSTYYTFVASGAFTAERSSMTNMDPGGLQLSGSGGVSLYASGFDYMGIAGGTNAYITARDLVSNATYYDITFGASRSTAGAPSAYNIRVEGGDSGLSWAFKDGGGELWGLLYDDDPNGRVLWHDTAFSVQSGSWSDAATWIKGAIPTAHNGVRIEAGHTVIVDITTATASTTTVHGTLSFSRVAHSSLTLVQGDITVEPGGRLDLGTEASPIPAGTTAHLVLAYGRTAGQYGLIVQDGGDFTVRGATKSPYGFALGNIDAAGESLTVSASSATGWAVGDTIAIGPTTGTGPSSTEQRVVTDISGPGPLIVS